SPDEIAAIFNCETVCIVDFFPPFQRLWPLACASGEPRNGAPRFRFRRPQQERVACFSIRFGPFSLLDESEHLTGQATALPTLDYSPKRRCNEVNCDAQDTRSQGSDKHESANPSRPNFFGRSQVEIILLCDGT